MSDDHGPGPAPGPATTSAPPRGRGLIRSLAHLLAGERPALPVEGRLAPFDGATGWLNSAPLTPEGLRGRVVLVDFWTYTCVNWLRTLPYVRAWAAKYAGAGLTVVGVHTPEFGFERDVDNVAGGRALLGVGYPIALDNDYAVWGAFANHAWPAAYVADGEGRIRFHHFGEGEYAATEMAIQQLLLEAGADGIDQDLVLVEPHGLEVAADWRTLRSPETYTGYGQSTGFAQEDVARLDAPAGYAAPARLPLNAWGLAGTWTVAGHAAVATRARRPRRLPVPRARPQPRHGPGLPGRVDPVPGPPRRTARGRRVRGRRATPTAAGSPANSARTSCSASRDRSPPAGSRSSSATAGVEVYCFTFG